MGSTGESLTIGEVSRRTGLSIDTLRFYEREKLLPAPERSATGRRTFREGDVEWIGVCRRLRDSGMPLARIAEYAALVRAGAGNEQQRLDLLRQHEAHVREQMAALRDALDVIAFKVATYTAALERGVADGLFVSDRADDDRFGGIHDHDSVRAVRVGLMQEQAAADLQAARARSGVMTVSNSTGVDRPGVACRRRRC